MFLQIIGSLKTVPVVNGKQNVPLNLIKIKFGANKRTQKKPSGKFIDHLKYFELSHLDSSTFVSS